MPMKVNMVGVNSQNYNRAKAAAAKMLSTLRKTESGGRINRAIYAFDLVFEGPNRAMAKTWQASKTISDDPQIKQLMGRLIDILYPPPKTGKI